MPTPHQDRDYPNEYNEKMDYPRMSISSQVTKAQVFDNIQKQLAKAHHDGIIEGYERKCNELKKTKLILGIDYQFSLHPYTGKVVIELLNYFEPKDAQAIDLIVDTSRMTPDL